MEENCKHKRIKKNYPHGKKSGPTRHCKDCGELVTNHMLMKRRKKNVPTRNN